MILVAFILLYVGGYFIPEDMPKLYGISVELTIVVLCLGNFIKTNYLNSTTKATWFCCSLWTISNLVYFSWFDKSLEMNFNLFMVECSMFISMIVYSNFKHYAMVESDEYNNEDCFIVFKRPKTFFEFFWSINAFPVSSVSLISKGVWYGYKRGKLFDSKEVEGCDGLLVKFNVEHDEIEKQMKKMIGSKWGLSNNCCHATSRIINSKIGFWDTFPCHFYKTVLEDVGCKKKKLK